MVECHVDHDTNVSVQTTHMRRRRRIPQGFATIWLSTDTDELDGDCKHMSNELRSFAHNVEMFTDVDECIDFVTDMENGMVSMIMTGILGEEMVPLIHEIPQINIILIVSTSHIIGQSVKKWSKVRTLDTRVTSISDVLNRTIKDCDRNSMPISFISGNDDFSTKNLDQLEPSFMYTQILKEILLQMEYSEQSINDFVKYCRDKNYATTDSINRFEREYYTHSPVWWYTSESFLYPMVNHALRNIEVDSLIKMAFFVHDLHRHLTKLHSEQLTTFDASYFTVYRGQALSKSDFEKLIKTKGGLMSFNNFLSTSKDPDTSLFFAESSGCGPDLMGILFEMEIDLSISSPPFARIGHLSQFIGEEEILFSMHTKFRIEEISQLENHDQLYHVKLKLTDDNDQQLYTLTERLRVEVEGSTGWNRLGQLLIKLGQYHKAQDLYEVLLDQATDESQKIHSYHQLGLIKANLGDYIEGSSLCEQSVRMKETMLPPNHRDLGASYNNLAMIYNRIGKYSKALIFYEKALAINANNLSPDDLHFGNLYNNIGFVHQQLANYPQTIVYLRKSLEILQKNLPANHSDIVTTYSNIGDTYLHMNDHSNARFYLEKALDIGQTIYPSNHPYLASLYNNIGALYYYIGEYQKAIVYLEKASHILEKVLSPKHPHLAATLNNIASAYDKIGQHSAALLYHQKSIDICENLPTNRLDLATYYSNMAGTYFDMKNFSQAAYLYEKSIEISQNVLPPNHIFFAANYCKLASVYRSMPDFSKALLFYNKELEVLVEMTPADLLSIAASYNNISVMQFSLHEYSKALVSAKKSLETVEKLPVPNHLLVVSYHNDIGLMYYSMGDNSNALRNLEKAIEIGQKTIFSNDPKLATSHILIGRIYESIKDYSKSLLFHQRALAILKQTLPANHYKVQSVEHTIQGLINKEKH